MDNEGYIKIYRKLKDWEWFTDSVTLMVFIYCLTSANWKDGKFKGIDVPRGSFITGRKKMAERLNISEQSLRTAINHLKSTNEITIKSTNKFSLVTIVNWEKYQDFEEELTNKTTNKMSNEQPTTNQQLTTIEERNNIKRNNNIFIKPTLEEVRAYCEERNNNVDPETFINFYESKGWLIGKNKMKDWKAAVRTWEKNRKEKQAINQTDLYRKCKSGNYDFKQLEEEIKNGRSN